MLELENLRNDNNTIEFEFEEHSNHDEDTYECNGRNINFQTKGLTSYMSTKPRSFFPSPSHDSSIEFLYRKIGMIRDEVGYFVGIDNDYVCLDSNFVVDKDSSENTITRCVLLQNYFMELLKSLLWIDHAQNFMMLSRFTE